MIKNKNLQLLLLLLLTVIGLSNCAPSDVTKMLGNYKKLPDFDQEHEQVHEEPANQNDDANGSNNIYGYGGNFNLSYNANETSEMSAQLAAKEEHRRQVTYYKRMAKKMSIIVSPILLVIGGIGNPLCIMILLRKKKPNSTIIYFCLLAVFDILVLYTGLLRQYIKEISKVDIRDFSGHICKIHVSFLLFSNPPVFNLGRFYILVKI